MPEPTPSLSRAWQKPFDNYECLKQAAQVEVQGVVMKDCKIVELPSGQPTVLGADSIVPSAKTIEKRKECH